MWQKCDISTTAVSYLVVTSSSESLPNDGEKSNQPKRFLFQKCDYGKIYTKGALFQSALSNSGIHKSILEG